VPKLRILQYNLVTRSVEFCGFFGISIVQLFGILQMNFHINLNIWNYLNSLGCGLEFISEKLFYWLCLTVKAPLLGGGSLPRWTTLFICDVVCMQGELLCIYHALPYVRHRGTLSLSLPNKANFGFDYSYALVAIMLTYIPGESTAQCLAIVHVVWKYMTSIWM